MFGKRYVTESIDARNHSGKERRTITKGLDLVNDGSRNRCIPANNLCKIFDRSSLKQRCQRYVPADFLLDLRHKPHRQQRVPTQVEEVVPDTHRTDVQNL